MTASNCCEKKMDKLRLVVFDVDGTLIKVGSIWRFLHEELDTEARSKESMELFYQGKITYSEWAKFDVSLWRNQSLKKIRRLVDEIPYVDGAKEVIEILKENNVKVVLLSAGLSLLGERIEKELNVDYSLSNELIVKDGLLTGDIKVNVCLDNKVKALNQILQRLNIKAEECCAVGDDESLIPLFQEVGLGIAFNPCSEEVEKNADIIVKGEDLRDILPYIFEK